jgi:hypothetical protein
MLITKKNSEKKQPLNLKFFKYVEDNCNLSSPEVQLQLNLKMWKKTIEA